MLSPNLKNAKIYTAHALKRIGVAATYKMDTGNPQAAREARDALVDATRHLNEYILKVERRRGR